MNDLSKIVVLIPSLNPTEKIFEVTRGLEEIGIGNILIINDGSSEDTKYIFDKLKEKHTVLTHSVNLGKGRGLKTGFNYILNEMKEVVGVVTCDDDMQHKLEDIKKVCEALLENSDSAVLGCRNFSQKNVPTRSKFGNILTKNILTFLVGLRVSDTQTGLRGIPAVYLPHMMNVAGERFEYETNMLLEFKAKDINIHEVQIETVYLENNRLSRFNPLVDSFKIYSIFGKYISASLFSFLIDILLFKFFFEVFNKSIVAGQIVARIISSCFNYFINRRVVFKSGRGSSVIRYYVLSAIQLLVSTTLVWALYNYFGQKEVLIKIIVDGVLFLVSYKLQNRFVFRRKK